MCVGHLQFRWLGFVVIELLIDVDLFRIDVDTAAAAVAAFFAQAQ